MYYMVFYPYSVSDDCDHDYKKSSPIMTPAAEPVTLGAEPMTAALRLQRLQVIFLL